MERYLFGRYHRKLKQVKMVELILWRLPYILNLATLLIILKCQSLTVSKEQRSFVFISKPSFGRKKARIHKKMATSQLEVIQRRSKSTKLKLVNISAPWWDTKTQLLAQLRMVTFYSQVVTTCQSVSGTHKTGSSISTRETKRRRWKRLDSCTVIKLVSNHH